MLQNWACIIAHLKIAFCPVTAHFLRTPLLSAGPAGYRDKEMHKVLIVDDSKLARMVMASAFRRIGPGWTLLKATSAADALQAISRGTVEIALIDFNMPDVDGLELVSQIRVAQPKMPIAAVSANVQDEIIG